jgi:geranylgeranyl transferase type-1 subunit beta
MDELRFDTELHTKYWKRCLKAVLPTGYTANDSSRMTLGFFTLCALDILDQQKNLLSEKERVDIRDWILSCQHPNGGFCGSTNHRFPDSYYADVGHGKQLMDPANLPATFFAILSLTFVGNLNQVRRRDCLKWLKKLQRDDGSFGELLTADGTIQGGRDMRYCYVASVVRWMLGGDQLSKEEDIDVDKLVDHLRNGQVVDTSVMAKAGLIANRHTMEEYQNLPNTSLMVSPIFCNIQNLISHITVAGYTYCAIASLHFLDRLPVAPKISYAEPNPSPNVLNIPDMIHWLVSRQVGYNDEDQEGDESTDKRQPDSQTPSADPLSLETLLLQDSECVGFNGRCNKPVDTCYAFWVGASLTVCKTNPHRAPIC